jgi:hypothetical protein
MECASRPPTEALSELVDAGSVRMRAAKITHLDRTGLPVRDEDGRWGIVKGPPRQTPL